MRSSSMLLAYVHPIPSLDIVACHKLFVLVWCSLYMLSVGLGCFFLIDVVRDVFIIYIYFFLGGGVCLLVDVVRGPGVVNL